MQPKPLCDWTRSEMKSQRELMLRIKLDPRYECGKCHRWASQPGWLCEPRELPRPDAAHAA